MRKATKILLLISEIIAFISIGVFLLFAVIFIIALSNQQILRELANSLSTAQQRFPIEAVILVLTVYMVICLMISVFSIPTAILCVKSRKQLAKGCEKHEMKVKAILLIVFGALSLIEIPIIPAIFLLAMNKKNFEVE